MSQGQSDDTEKSHEPTPQKLQKAREKGEVSRSSDLGVAAAYVGLVLVAAAIGHDVVQQFGAGILFFFENSDRLANLVFEGYPEAALSGPALRIAGALAPWFLVPAGMVLLSILAQRSFVVAPAKLKPKLSRISILANARNKFGRAGLFEFGKNFVKLVLYSVCMAMFMIIHLPELILLMRSGHRSAAGYLGEICLELMIFVLPIAIALGAVDAIWQYYEFQRKNRMSRKEIADEHKDSEGDPHIKQQRRERGQRLTSSQIAEKVPGADVIIVNPTHYAVALKWSRAPGSAPECVAKGADHIAARIREIAEIAGVPIHSDPATARALFATVAVGEEIKLEHYAPVAAAIQFSERIREKVKSRIQN